jgi:hypothetical protein
MMGNFLTTLGVEPAEDREMFSELGLNVARQDDNGANPRPDNLFSVLYRCNWSHNLTCNQD